MPCQMFLAVSLGLCFFGLCTSNIILNEPCSKPPVIENFDKDKFSGLWYHIERYIDDNQAIVLEFMTCSTVTYTIIDDQTVAMNNTFNTPDDKKRQDYITKLIAHAKIRNQKEPAKWIVFLQSDHDSSEYGSLVDLDLNVWILDTDYNNYALVWTCQSDGKRSLIDAVILSRKSTLDETSLLNLHNRLDNYQLKKEFFHSVNQKSCQY